MFRAALPGGLTDLFVVLGVEVFFLTFGFSEAELSTMSAILLIVIGIMVLYEVCKPLTGSGGCCGGPWRAPRR